MSTGKSEKRMEIIEKALQVAVVSLWAEYREDFEEEFTIEELQKCGKETATLAKNGLSVEAILHEALQEFERK